MSDIFDILVIGGGVNGSGIARDAAGRGLKVLLCEKDDLAQHTSSSSTKLIHGGLRYLEHYEFRLVRESLIEREVLLRAAPHIIWPMRFVLPHHKGLRPAWLIRLGLFLYDNLGGRKLLPGTIKVKFKNNQHEETIKDNYKFGFEYSDCWVEDSRLVTLNAVDAYERGAQIEVGTSCKSLLREGKIWGATLVDCDGNEKTIKAKSVVNAAGPWVDQIIQYADPGRNKKNLRLIKGSHIITRKLFDGNDSYILQNSDDRIVFAIPYENEFTLIGTTDVPFTHAEGKPTISDEETDYLCSIINDYFKTPISRADIVSTYSGVRPLYDDQEEDASVVTRDYVFDLDTAGDMAPILSIFGGKITTYRKLSEQAVDKLEEFVSPPKPGHWTRDTHLPGGDIDGAQFEAYLQSCAKKWTWLPAPTLRRLVRAYGTRVEKILSGRSSVEDLGIDFSAGLYEAEVQYLIDHEFVSAAEDITMRRSKLALHMNEEGLENLKDWFSNYSSVKKEKTVANLMNDQSDKRKKSFDQQNQATIHESDNQSKEFYSAIN